MVERAGVFLDGDFAASAVLRRQSPSLLEVVPALQRKFQPQAGIALFASSRGWLHDPEMSRIGMLDCVRVNIAEGASADMALAVAAARELTRLDRLVLFTGDSDFIPLVAAAAESGIATTVVCPRQSLSFRLGLTAGNLVDPSELLAKIEGLIRVGDGPRMAAALAKHIGSAMRRVVIIDNYVEIETIRLAAGVGSDVEIVLLGTKFNARTRAEARAMRAAGRAMRLVQHGDIHDRWLKVDNEWFHSGHSFKDIGKKFSRISVIVNPREVEEHDEMLNNLIASGNEIVL